MIHFYKRTLRKGSNKPELVRVKKYLILFHQKTKKTTTSKEMSFIWLKMVRSCQNFFINFPLFFILMFHLLYILHLIFVNQHIIPNTPLCVPKLAKSNICEVNVMHFDPLCVRQWLCGGNAKNFFLIKYFKNNLHIGSRIFGNSYF